MEEFCFLWPHDLVVPIGGAEGLRYLIMGWDTYIGKAGESPSYQPQAQGRNKTKPWYLLLSCVFAHSSNTERYQQTLRYPRQASQHQGPVLHPSLFPDFSF